MSLNLWLFLFAGRSNLLELQVVRFQDLIFLKEFLPWCPLSFAGLTTGSNEQRSRLPMPFGDLVERTDENAIKPFVVPFTGPLIRVATQATTYPPGVKTAILSASDFDDG